jgi:AcrR family transcriptional regulator
MNSCAVNRKDQITQVATDLFSRLGYDKMTVKDLATACGVTEPALYRHFVSKQAIFGEVLDSLACRLDTDELFDRLAHESDIEKLLHELATYVISFFQRNEDLQRLLLYAVLMDHPKARKVFQATRGVFANFLEEQLVRLREDGLVQPVNCRITARCFIGMVCDCALGQTLWQNLQSSPYPPAEVVANNVPIYARGLKRQRRARQYDKDNREKR